MIHFLLIILLVLRWISKKRKKTRNVDSFIKPKTELFNGKKPTWKEDHVQQKEKSLCQSLAGVPFKMMQRSRDKETAEAAAVYLCYGPAFSAAKYVFLHIYYMYYTFILPGRNTENWEVPFFAGFAQLPSVAHVCGQPE